MEQRPAPRVTIAGGPGGQLEAAARDELRAGRPEGPRSRVRWALVIVAVLLGGFWLAQSRPAEPAGTVGAVGTTPPTAVAADAPPFVLHAADVRFATDRALMSLEVVRNTSDSLSVVGVRTIPGLSVRLVGADGQGVALPLDVGAAVVQSPPTSQDEPAQLLLAEFTLASCSSLPPYGQPYRGGTLVELQTVGPNGPGSTFVGPRYPVVPRFRQSC